MGEPVAKRVCARDSRSLTSLLLCFAKSKKEVAKQLMKEPVPNESKRVLGALPDSIYFSFPIQRKSKTKRKVGGEGRSRTADLGVMNPSL